MSEVFDPGTWRRLHPASMASSTLRSLPSAAAGMVGAFTVLRDLGPAVGLLVALGLLGLVGGLTVLSWWRFRFRVGEREIAIERGVLSRQRRVIPFDRVRDVAIERKLLARLLGTARVRIETGGNSADEGDLDMIGLIEAEQLREHVRRANAGVPEGSVSQEAAAEPEEPVVYAMDMRRVLIAGVFNFSLLFIALLFGALQYLDDFNLFDLSSWVESQRSRYSTLMFGLAEAAWIVVAVLLLGVVSGLVRTTAREFGFRLTAGANGLRRRRGLLTLSEVLIPARRTEAARVQRRWFSGLWGWRSLAFQTLGADRKEGGVQTAAPLARRDEVEAILERAGFPPMPNAIVARPPARALLRRCAPYFVLAPAMAALGAIDPPLGWLALIPVIFAAAKVLRWRNDRHLVGETALFMTGGLIGRTLWIVPFEKLQTVSTARGPLQRPLGLATLVLDTAGAPMIGAPRVADLPQAAAEDLARRLLAAFYQRRAALRAGA